jgi:hypothetical protein
MSRTFAGFLVAAATIQGCCCMGKPTKHRPVPVACAPSRDAGVPDGGCGLPGVCADECLVDAECDGGVCSCAGNTFGYAKSTANLCVPAGCRVDADCPDGYCSPTVGAGNFYGIQGYECHSCADSCVNDGDCGATNPGELGQPYCAYSAQVGHWACGTFSPAG